MEPVAFNPTDAGITMAQAPRNVVFIGETCSGKSSVINLIADHDCAVVSPDATPCTSNFASYDVSIKGKPYRLWDTPGLKEASGFELFTGRPTQRSDSLKRFLQERRRHGELDLLVLCVQGGRALKSISKVYTAFCHATRQTAIPVAVAITHLEREQPTMEAWWQVHERELWNLGLLFDGYACLTCLSPHHRRWASQQDIRALISAEYPQLKRAQSQSTLPDWEYPVDPNNPCVWFPSTRPNTLRS